jgi:holo-[acyl-carrier protein] synthase
VAVLGLGVDLVSVRRMARAMRRGRFLERVFTAGERALLARPHPEEAMAVRFAAKEAAMKALGLTITLRRLREVEVVRSPGQPPELRLHGEMAARLQELGGRQVRVSLSHEREMAVAVVVIEG